MDIALLEGIPLFSSLTLDQRLELANLFQVREVSAGESIFWVGEPGDEFFVIRRGNVSISVPDLGGKEIVLADLGAGCMFGEIALLDSGPRTATARARSNCEVLVLERSSFGAFVEHYPTVALKIMQVLGARQRQTVEKLRGIRNLNEIIQDRQTRWEQIAQAIARLASSQLFLAIHAVALVSWITFNLLAGKAAIDPFPFPFLCFWSSTEAIFLSLFILVAQDQQGQKDRARTELEYQVALKMQVEMMQLHQKLDVLLAAREEEVLQRTQEEERRRPAIQLTIRQDVVGRASEPAETEVGAL